MYFSVLQTFSTISVKWRESRSVRAAGALLVAAMVSTFAATQIAGAAPTGAAQPEQGFDGVTTGYVCNVETGRYLDADGANGNSGRYNVSTSLSPTGDDEWDFERLPDGRFTLQNREKRTFLDADGADKGYNVDGSQSVRDDDKWEAQPLGGGVFVFFNTYRGRFLDAEGIGANWNVHTVAAPSATSQWMVVSLDNSCRLGMGPTPTPVPPAPTPTPTPEPIATATPLPAPAAPPFETVTLTAPVPLAVAERLPVISPSSEMRLLGSDQASSIEVAVDAFDGDVLSGRVELATNRFNFLAAIDISQSTIDGRPGCGGDEDGDGIIGSVVDCEIVAALDVVGRLQAGGAQGSQVGVVGFSASAAAADVSPEPGQQQLAAPSADANANGIADVVEVIRSLEATDFDQRPNIGLFTTKNLLHGTNFHDAAVAACDVSAGSNSAPTLVAFISDGRSMLGGGVEDLLPCGNTTFHSFAVGAGASCSNGTPSLQDLADRTGGSCAEVDDPENLPDILPALLIPEIVSISMTVDGGSPIDLTGSIIDAVLPAAGDLSFALDTTADPALQQAIATATELCITALAVVGGQEVPVANCSMVERPDGSLEYAWQTTDAPAAVALSDPAAPSPTFVPSAVGTYAFAVAMVDSLGRSWTDTIEVIVGSSDPADPADSSESTDPADRPPKSLLVRVAALPDR